MMVVKAIYSTESAQSRCPHSLLQRITEVLEYFYFKYCILYYLLYKVCFRVTIDIEEYFRLLMMIVGSTMNT